MRKLIAFLIVFLGAFGANAQILPIEGTLTVCAGSGSYVRDSTTGGAWSSSNVSVATIGTSGYVTAVSAGTSLISYTVGTTAVTAVYLVNPTPAAITGLGVLCSGATITLSDATSGGTWSSDDVSVATIDASTGVVTGMMQGVVELLYTLPGGCYKQTYDTVQPIVDSITGPLSVCVGYTVTDASGTTGGVWSSSTTSVAGVGSVTGVVTGVAPGTAVISYSATSACGSGVVTRVITVTASGTAGTITGSSTVSVGGTTYLSDGISGGTWSSGTTSVATVGAGTGLVTGVTTGTAVITYAVSSCSGIAYATFVITVTSAYITPITGTFSACVGSTGVLYDSSYTGGWWSSSSPTIASVGSSIGIVDAIAPGTATITYWVGGSYTTAVFTVLAAPAAVSGTTPLCVGSTATYTDATSGGTWSSSSTYYATVSTTGLVTAVNDGSVDIIYTLSDGCSRYLNLTVGAYTAGGIGGDSTLCSGTSITLTDGVSGGVWTSGNPGVATVGTGTGVVTGVSAGGAMISYAVSGMCGMTYATFYVIVSSTTDPGVIAGTASVYTTLTTSLSESVYGGSWSSSNTAVGTIDPSTGIVTGIAPGTTTISYAVTGCAGTAYATFVVTVSTLDEISGNVIFTGGYSGYATVWLIYYNPGTMMLEAVDSQYVYCSGDSVAYQFFGMGTDSFRVKAAISDTISGITGFIPTYHTSFFYWHDATVINHIGGTVDTYKDINMQTGTVTSGPGFVGGDVMTGANKATSGSAVPAVGLLMVCETSAGSVYQQTYTTSTGSYSFSNLPIGTYTIHPEAINYLSTDFTGVTITATATTVNGTNFVQHTKSHTITPGSDLVQKVVVTANAVALFPNPTSGMLNIQWQDNATETGTVVITDLTGRQVLKTNIQLQSGSGMSQVDLSDLTSGMYLISVHSAGINYNGKVELTK